MTVNVEPCIGLREERERDIAETCGSVTASVDKKLRRDALLVYII